MVDLKNTVLNNVLSYISTAKCSLSHDKVILNALAFYTSESIIKAKDIIFDICDERKIKRKACSSHPNPTEADLEDILLLFEKCEGQPVNLPLPNFVSSGYMSLPPCSGFESLASVMCSMRDEISALRLEVSEVRKSNEKDLKALDNVGCIIQDVAEIKLLIHNLPINVSGRTPESVINYEISQQLDVSSRDPVDRNEDSCQTSQVIPNLSISAVPQISSEPNAGVPNVPINSPVEELTVPTYADMVQVNRGGRSTSNRNPSNHRGGASSANRRPSRINESRRPILHARRVNISGTRPASTGLSSGQRVLDVFVGGCGLETTVEEIKNYCSVNEINVKKCETLVTKSEWYRSYKISVDALNRDKLLDAEFWPQGIFVRKFFRPRTGNN